MWLYRSDNLTISFVLCSCSIDVNMKTQSLPTSTYSKDNFIRFTAVKKGGFVDIRQQLR